MTRGERILCLLYAGAAIVALFATWIHNMEFLMDPDSGGVAGFFRQAYANHAAASFANDLFALAVVAIVFMIVEARRLHIPRVWAYVALSFVVAISVAFPLFLIARQLAMARGRIEE